jgi:hypothetical protein
VKQCKTNLSTAVNRNMLKLSLITFSKMLFIFKTSLLDCVLQCGEDMSFRQYVVLELLVKEEIPTLDIHAQLQHAYWVACTGATNIRYWVQHIKNGNTDIVSSPVVFAWKLFTLREIKRISKLIQENLRVTQKWQQRLKEGTMVHQVVGSLGYHKVCATWVPGFLTDEYHCKWKKCFLTVSGMVCCQRW